jgi:tRNA(adenine34) deaminase
LNDAEYMSLALEQARAAPEHNDVPIGAVIVRGGQVVASVRNERELRNDPTAHAEILALRAATEGTGSWRLEDATMYVTLEPCPMCAGALVLARLERLVYGTADPRAGAALSLYNIVSDPRLNHSVEIERGVLEEECSALLRGFFEGKRF